MTESSVATATLGSWRRLSIMCPSDVVVSPLGREELLYGDAECSRNFFDVVDRNIADLPLNVGNKCAVQFRFVCQFFLRPATRTPKTKQIFRQQSSSRQAGARDHTVRKLARPLESARPPLLSQPRLRHNMT